MKKKLHILLLAISGLAAQAQAPAVDWTQFYGGSDLDFGTSIITTADAGYLVAGYNTFVEGEAEGTYGGYDVWILKLDAGGSQLWQKRLGGTGSDMARRVTATQDGGYVIAATTNSADGDVTSSHGDNDFWLIKIDASGNLVWENTFGGSGQDEVFSVTAIADGGFVATGISFSNDGDISNPFDQGNGTLWTMKVDAGGVLIWDKNYGGSVFEVGKAVIETQDGSIAVIGATYSHDGDVSVNHGVDTGDYWLIKLDAQGELLWEKSYGGSSEEFFDMSLNTIIETADGGFAFAGSTMSSDGDVTFNHGSFDYWVVKTGADGTLEWQKSLGGTEADYGAFIVQDEAGNFIVSGSSSSTDGDITQPSGFHDAWAVKLDGTGNLLWQKSYGNAGDDFINAFVAVEDGYVFAGQSDHVDGLYYDVLVFKFSYDVMGMPYNATTAFKAYPNPAKDTVHFGSAAPVQAVTIFDMQGRLVVSQKDPGGGLTQIDVKSLPSGVYMVNLQTDGSSRGFKLVKE